MEKHLTIKDVFEGLFWMIAFIVIAKTMMVNLHAEKDVVAFAGKNNTLVFKSGKSVKVQNSTEFMQGEEVFVSENKFVAHKMLFIPLESEMILDETALASL